MTENRYEAKSVTYGYYVYDKINKKYMDVEQALVHILNKLNRLENKLL